MVTIIPHTTRASGTVLTASIYNADHQNHITNATTINDDAAFVDQSNTWTAGQTFNAATVYGVSGAIFRNSNTASLRISGGSSDQAGGHIEFVGGAHATLPNQILYDASTHAFRGQAGSGTPTVTIGGNNVWHGANLTSGALNTIYGYTPVNPTRNVIAGNGLTGGGTLAADRTFTMGTPGTITASSTNSVTATSHTHALTFSIDSGDVTTALGFTPVTNARNVTAGNGLTGGGNLTADRTFTLGTPTSISNTSTNSVTSTSHTHALSFTAAEVYTGSSSSNTDYPIGTPLNLVGSEVNRSASVAVDFSTSNSTDFVTSGGTSLSGTWRGRGRPASGNTLVQRTA